jgi:uncharacterized repeat protein (TIGR03833 family)
MKHGRLREWMDAHEQTSSRDCESELWRKQNQRSGTLTEGIVQRILTKSPTHPHGIKVMLEDGVVGRVKEVLG